jgi:hypothetical protein
MKQISYEFIDKSSWGPGPWQHEQCDKLQWVDEATGLPCLAVRNPQLGNWCGYCGIAEGHPYFGVPYDQVPDSTLEVHGGITFSDFCAPHDKEHGICHVVEPGENDHVFWFGFDCSHAFDRSPGLEAIVERIDAETGVRLQSLHHSGIFGQDIQYRMLDYVRAECAKLAGQLKAIAA